MLIVYLIVLSLEAVEGLVEGRLGLGQQHLLLAGH